MCTRRTYCVEVSGHERVHTGSLPNAPHAGMYIKPFWTDKGHMLVPCVLGGGIIQSFVIDMIIKV